MVKKTSIDPTMRAATANTLADIDDVKPAFERAVRGLSDDSEKKKRRGGAGAVKKVTKGKGKGKAKAKAKIIDNWCAAGILRLLAYFLLLLFIHYDKNVEQILNSAY